jgi:hypothetical protein
MPGSALPANDDTTWRAIVRKVHMLVVAINVNSIYKMHPIVVMLTKSIPNHSEPQQPDEN